MTRFMVKKADGTEEPFNEKKLLRSLERSGVPSNDTRLVDSVLEAAKGAETTQHIYERTLEALRQVPGGVAARYSIKRAVLALGPTGFPFERYMAEIFKAHGAKSVLNDVTLNGKCVPHEVDILLTINGKRVGIESKFHNSLGTKTDIKDILYIHARYHDLTSARNPQVDEGWLITNTRLSKQALQYAMCSQVTAIAWEYPNGRGIQKLIESVGLHPVTTLTTLTTHEHQELINHGIILAKSLRDRRDLLQKLHVEESRHEAILDEAGYIAAAIHHEPYSFDFFAA